MELQFLLYLNFRCLHGKLPIMVRGGTILGGVFVLGGDVTHRRPCWMLWSMQVIGKGFAKGSCQSVRACERTDSATFLAQYIILSFLPQIQRLSPANRATNGMHNRSIFTITQTLFICLNISQCNSTPMFPTMKCRKNTFLLFLTIRLQHCITSLN